MVSSCNYYIKPTREPTCTCSDPLDWSELRCHLTVAVATTILVHRRSDVTSPLGLQTPLETPGWPTGLPKPPVSVQKVVGAGGGRGKKV